MVRRALLTGVVAMCLATGVARAQQAIRDPAPDWKSDALASFDSAWATIDETFYDPAFGGLNWAAVRDELRPRAEAAASIDDVRQVIRDMLSRLHQSHFVLLAPTPGEDPTGEAAVPVDLRVRDGDVVVTRVGPGVPEGLTAGERLLGVDGLTVAAMRAAARGSDDRARDLDLWRRAFVALHGPAGSQARLELRAPDGTTYTVEARRRPETGQRVQLGNLPPLHVRVDVREVSTPAGRTAGVIGFNVWMAAVDAPLAEAVDRFRRSDGLVLDLRGNPGGLAEMIRGVAGHVLNEPSLLGTMQMRMARLEFRANPRRSTADGRTVAPFAGPVAILVDQLTASASECFAGGLQSLGRARIFGERTMGQALPASTRTLPDGDILMYAVGDFVTSDGHRLEGDGVRPDEPVTPSPAALAAGRDPVLESSLAWIDRMRGSAH